MAAAGGGDDPRRPPGHAHEYGPYKKLLWGIFEDMDNAEYKSFKHHLDCVVSSDNVSIPKYRVQRAKRQDMPDLILRYIQRREALEVVARILRDLPNVQLLERIRQFTHPEPGTFGYMVMQIKHAAESEEDYQRKCEDIAARLNLCSPGLGNPILDEMRRRDCVLVKYLLYTGELVLNRPKDIIETMSTEECKEELRHLGVIYLKVEGETLFTGELHLDPRTWDPVEVTQWVARTLLPRDPTATIPDLQLTGAEICTRPETWFTNKFPAGQGRVLYSDLQQRRDDTARQRKFGNSDDEYERVVEGTHVTFLVSAYLMSMVLTLLGQQFLAVDILRYLQSLMRVVERQSKNKKLIHSSKFNHSWASKNIIKERRRVPSAAASVVFGTEAIAISSEDYSHVVTSAAEAMEVIGDPLEIKVKPPWWKRTVVAAGIVAGAAAGAVAFVVAGPVALVIAGIVAAVAAMFGVNQFLVVALRVIAESEKKTSIFKVNYLQALLLLPGIVDKREMDEEELGRIVRRGKEESEYKIIRDVEKDRVDTAYRVSSLTRGTVPTISTYFNYRAKEWLTDDSITNVNDTMIIAHTHFELRHLLRDVFALGVVGSKGSGKATLVKSVFAEAEQRGHHTTTGPYDIRLYDGSKDLEEDILPVLTFPGGQGEEVDAAHKLCTGVCGAFICMVDYVAGYYTDIGALARVKDLSVPVLLCVNKCGGVRNQQEASQILDRYKTQVSRDFGSLRNLTEVVLTDFQVTDRPAWLTGAEGVKYWIRDAIQNHKRYASNA